MGSVFYDEFTLDKIIAEALEEGLGLKNGIDDFATRIMELRNAMSSVRTRSEEFKLATKEKYERTRKAKEQELDFISRNIFKYPNSSQAVKDYSAPVRSDLTTFRQPQVQVSAHIPPKHIAVERPTKTKIYVSKGDFPSTITQELQKINSNFEYVFWTDDLSVPSNSWLLHFEDVVTRLDDEALPKKIKDLALKWDNRFVFVKLYKEHGSAVADYRNNQYESKFLPGIRVAKGIYRLNVRDNGINKSISKEIIDASELRTMLQTIAK